MVVTVEMIVLLVGFVATVVSIYSVFRKFKNETVNKAQKDEEKMKSDIEKEIEWRIDTKKTLEDIRRNSEESRMNQTRIDEMVRENTQDISLMKLDIKNIKARLDKIQGES